MHFEPRNRLIQLEEIDKKSTEKKAFSFDAELERKNNLYQVVALAPDCGIELQPKMRVVVVSHLVDVVDIDGKKFIVCPESAIIGVY